MRNMQATLLPFQSTFIEIISIAQEPKPISTLYVDYERRSTLTIPSQIQKEYHNK